MNAKCLGHLKPSLRAVCARWSFPWDRLSGQPSWPFWCCALDRSPLLGAPITLPWEVSILLPTRAVCPEAPRLVPVWVSAPFGSNQLLPLLPASSSLLLERGWEHQLAPQASCQITAKGTKRLSTPRVGTRCRHCLRSAPVNEDYTDFSCVSFCAQQNPVGLG